MSEILKGKTKMKAKTRVQIEMKSKFYEDKWYDNAVV